MRPDKRKSAERLFDVIGMIDDSIIAENQENVAPKKNRSPSFLRQFAPSLAVILVFAVCLSAMFTISRFFDEKSEGEIGDEAIGSESDKDGYTDQERFDNVLSSASLCASVTRVSLDEIDFFSGNVELIWSYKGEDGYYKLTLGTKNKVGSVEEKLKNGYTQISYDDAGRCDYMVWISYGNGEVVSPQLKYSYSGGNVGYGELFEYSPEVIPSDDFVELIENTVN